MESRQNTLSWAVKWAAVLIAILYSVFFFIKLLQSLSARRASGIDVDWSLTQNPQFFIAILLAAAAISLSFWHNLGKLVALVFFGFIIVKFALWANLTADIKMNTGLESIPQANWIGNIWIGASWAEVAVGVSAILLLFLDLILIWNRRSEIASTVRDFFLAHSSAPKYQ
jgi:hypothetical protein